LNCSDRPPTIRQQRQGEWQDVGVLDPDPFPSRVLDPDPFPSRVLSRRRVLVGSGRGLLALALVGPTVACGRSEPPAPDPLEAELAAARRDSEMATAAAKAAKPAVAAALSEVAAERARHATALVEELARAAGKPTPTETPETTSATPAPAQQPALPPPRLRDVIDALRKSADSAAKLVPTLSGYRAGLMGSIAAACTTSFTVGLPPDTPDAPPEPAQDKPTERKPR
jgi:hypothetical protein